MITPCVLKRYFDCVEHGFHLIVGQWKHRSSGIFFRFLPAFFELLLLIVHSAKSYTLTAPVGFTERGVSAARCWLVIDPGWRLRHWRGRREDFLAIPGQRRINPLAVNELLGPLRRFAFRDNIAFPALGIHGAPRP